MITQQVEQHGLSDEREKCEPGERRSMSSSEQGMHEGMGVGHTEDGSSRGFTPGNLILRFVFGVGGLFVAHTGDAFSIVVRESLAQTECGLRVLVGRVSKLSLLRGSKLSHARLSKIGIKKLQGKKRKVHLADSVEDTRRRRQRMLIQYWHYVFAWPGLRDPF